MPAGTKAIAACFEQEGAPQADHSTIPEMLRSLNKLPNRKQQYVWSKVGILIVTIRRIIQTELATTDRIPNHWMQLMRASQIKRLGAAAEKYHRKNLRRQMRHMPARPVIYVSDDSHSESDVEFLSSKPPLHPDPVLCNALS